MASGDTRKVILENTDGEILIPYTEVASSTTVGRVKPDGTTTSVDSTGAMSVVGKQDTLVSGTNIKTVNGNSLLGSGNVTIGAQVSYGNITGTLSDQTDLQDALDAKANDSDVVKLTGNQTIAGEKTYTSQVYYNRANDARIRTIAPNLTNGTNPSVTQWAGIDLQDKNNVEMAQQLAYVDKDSGNTVSAQWVRVPGATTNGFGVRTVGNKVTGAVETYAITPATSDNSTKIATTANVDAKITAQAVKLTGDQTIAGIKTFTDTPVINNTGTGNGTLTIKNSVTTYGTSAVDLVTATSNGYNQFLLHFQEGNKWCTSWNQDPTSKNIILYFTGCEAVYAPTPATSDNSQRAATTAFVNNKFQVVTALPASPTAGVFYFVKE